MTEEKKPKYCPFRQNHFCGVCVLYNEKFKNCELIAMNANLGELVKTLKNKKIKKFK